MMTQLPLSNQNNFFLIRFTIGQLVQASEQIIPTIVHKTLFALTFWRISPKLFWKSRVHNKTHVVVELANPSAWRQVFDTSRSVFSLLSDEVKTNPLDKHD